MIIKLEIETKPFIAFWGHVDFDGQPSKPSEKPASAAA
jgi:hypothetical protein